MPNYDGKCLSCGFHRRDGSKVGVYRRVKKSHAREKPDCPGDFHIYNHKGTEVFLNKRTGWGKGGDTPAPAAKRKYTKAKKTQPTTELHFCPRCGFNMELLRMAVGAVERMQ